MKKLVLGFLLVLLCGSVQAEMMWFGLNPSPQAGNAGDSGQVTQPGLGDPQKGWAGSYGGFEIELKVVDSAAGAISADSSSGTYYTTCINTENVIAATGMFEIIAITDTSTTTGHLFALGGDSVFVWYTIKTGYVPYDPDANVLVDAVEATTVSGTAIRVPITLSYEGDEGVDTLFKPFTWVEFTCWDSTRWAEVNVAADPIPIVDSLITGTWVPADTMVLAGTYAGGGQLGRYHIRIFDPGGDDDSIISTFYKRADTIVVDTALITEAAQAIPDGIDTGMTINFDDDATATHNDVFIFHVSDSLHYGKTVKYKLRAGLNLQKR